MKFNFLLVFLIFITPLYLRGQTKEAVILGTITEDATGQGLEGALVYEKQMQRAVETDANGNFQLSVPSGRPLILIIRRVGYDQASIKLESLAAGIVRKVNFNMIPADAGFTVTITGESIGDQNMVRARVEEFKLLPSVSGNIESLLPSIALGTSGGTGGELTSQYNVRGGNYDENLVYVNDFEIFRSQLIRSGQQEGLSFPNADLIRDLAFSSGGFEAKYGDKLSSVLDIKYKRPDSLAGSVTGSLLGGSAHLEGSVHPYKGSAGKIRYLLGGRYKTTSYLLGSLDVKGEYLPNFTDIQAYITYDFNPQWQLGVIGNYNLSTYHYTPNSSEIPTGTFNNTLRLSADYEGQERDRFLNAMSGVSLTYVPSNRANPSFIKFLSSVYNSDEAEAFDIQSHFDIKVIELDFEKGSTKEVGSLGAGTQHNFARNRLRNLIYNGEIKGGIEFPKFFTSHETSHFIYGGIKYQREHFLDRLNEWYRSDSVGYSLPFDDDRYYLNSVIKSNNDVTSDRMTAFIRETYTYKMHRAFEIQTTVGLRAGYWSFNNEWILSPRGQFLFRPLRRTNPITYKLAGGIYQQQPFYREMRRPDGTLNEAIRSQKSAQGILGVTYDFHAGKQDPVKLRFIAEAFYKSMWDLISYDVDNVRIRYSGENNATGYATGLDMRLNGEFVNGFESWFNVSFLRTREHLTGVQHIDAARQPVEDVPRPSDRLFQAALYFQDYLPQNKNFRTNIQLSYGSGLSFGVPWDNTVQRNPLRFHDYQRIDIGFSVLLWDQSRRAGRPGHFLRFTKNTWLSLEIFNLLDNKNVADYNWVKDFNNIAYAFPSNLTSRRLNLRLRMEF